MSVENPNKSLEPKKDQEAPLESEGIISGAGSDDYERGQKEARAMFLEEKMAKDDSYENWLDLGRSIREDLRAQTDPEFKARLQGILEKSKWEIWSRNMNQREHDRVEMLKSIREMTGIQDMKQNEELLNEYLIDPIRFTAKLNALKNQN